MLRQTIPCLLRRQLGSAAALATWSSVSKSTSRSHFACCVSPHIVMAQAASQVSANETTPERHWTDDRQVTEAGQSLPHRSHASSEVALQLKHIAALEPATVSLDEMVEWIKAKMGRGLETVLDESRRRCKVLVPKATKQGKGKKAAATPPPAATTPIIVHWPGLEAALESTRKQLCPWFPPGSLHAHLHTVQQYDEGDFFTLHRDAPKLPYHIMTMSVDCSPAGMTHEGGEIVLDARVDTDSDGRKIVEGTEVPFAGGGSFAAWFNSTYHEILPVTKGRRLSATYNITVDAAAATAPFSCDDPDIEKAVDEAAAKLRELEFVFFSDSNKPSKWILDEEYVFDPQYKGNHVFLLQGRDRLKHEAMCRAFGRDRVVLTGRSIEKQYCQDDEILSMEKEELVDEDHVQSSIRCIRPYYEHHADTGNEGGTHTLYWRIGVLSLKPKTIGNEKENTVDKKEDEQ